MSYSWHRCWRAFVLVLAVAAGCTDDRPSAEVTAAITTLVWGEESPPESDDPMAAGSLPVGTLRQLFLASDLVVSGQFGDVVVADTGQRGSEGEVLVRLRVERSWRGPTEDVIVALSDSEFRDASAPDSVVFLRRVRDPRGFLEFRQSFGDIWLLTPGPNSILAPTNNGAWLPVFPSGTLGDVTSAELTAAADDTQGAPAVEIDGWGSGSIIDDESSRHLDGACAAVREEMGPILLGASLALDGVGDLPPTQDVREAFGRATPYLREIADSLMATKVSDVRLRMALEHWFLADSLVNGPDGELSTLGTDITRATWRAIVSAVADFQLALVGVIVVNCKSFV